MVVIACPVTGCNYETPDVEASVVASLLNLHNNEHLRNGSPGETRSAKKQKPPKLERPKIGKESSEENWNIFCTRWTMFVRDTEMTTEETLHQLFNCCDDELGDEILRGYPNAISGTERELLDVIKKLAVFPVAISVRRSELISTRQDHGEGIRSFVAKLKGKAATCAYTANCTSSTCEQIINFTDVIVKDVIVAGLVDDDIKKDVLGWADLDIKSVDETVNFIEAKEKARDALAKHTTINAALSTHRSSNKTSGKESPEKIACEDCDALTEKYVWSKKSKKMVDCVTVYHVGESPTKQKSV